MRIVFFLLVLVYCGNAESQVNNYVVGDTVNDFTVTDNIGTVHTLSDYTSSGKWVLINFCYKNCPPCQGLNHHFNELYHLYGCNDFDLACLFISLSDTDAELSTFQNDYGGNYYPAPSIGIDGGGDAVTADFGVPSFPKYCLIDTNMVLRNADIWPIVSVATFTDAFAAAGFYPNTEACPVTEIVEIASEEKRLIKVVNYLGQEIEPVPNTTLIYIYNDGSVEKVFIYE